jgi:multidrug transporter EmrE-like cation transporter
MLFYGIDLQMIWITLMCIVEILGDFAIEKYTQTWKAINLAQGVGLYGGVIFFLIKSLIGSNILYVNGMWDGISGLIESFAAYYFLGERLDRPVQYIGLGLIILGVFLMKK